MYVFINYRTTKDGRVNKHNMEKHIAELQSCEEVLGKYFHNIKQIFKYYSSKDNKETSMGVTDLITLVKQCKITDKTITDAYVRKMHKLLSFFFVLFFFAYVQHATKQHTHTHNEICL